MVVDRPYLRRADDVFVNGDPFIPKARALEPVFKNRMFSEVQA